jgi:hypothetical protein
MASRNAFVSPQRNGCVVAFDEQSDKQDQKLIAQLALRLSGKLHCPVLAILIHDDDILWYQLCEDGTLRDEYDSTPGYFNPSAGKVPKGGDALRLCPAFGCQNIGEVDQILRQPQFEKSGYVFASQRHADLVRALGLPEFAVYGAYRGLAAGHYPEGITKEDLTSVSK